MTELRKVTLAVITSDTSILLGYKKRGFGSGKYNGFGGKPESGESLLDCVIRETKEEVNITLDPKKLTVVAILYFYFEDKPEWNQQVHVYKTNSYLGTPTESEEMKPAEFPLNAIPYDKMWIDDIHWLPLVLEGGKVKGSFTFAKDGSILKKELTLVEEL
ncbi:MAG: 8-oxo-dGTP pyrophosphatase MutT (NUDIX family) [Candidatus Woesearchaeota archaeon]|jgi:8-oxo-dGTP pyrophosphatase MutT (NUDIX family)